MIYSTLKHFTLFVYLAFYRRIYFLNRRRVVPAPQALLVLSNHSNAFIDPMLTASFTKRSFYFWARSNEFKQRLSRMFMTSLQMLPIYRAAYDGKEETEKNKNTFTQTKKILKSGFALYIAPEGNNKKMRQLRPLKTGAAQLALEYLAEQNWQGEIHLQPLGIYYSNFEGFRSEVYLSYSEAIPVSTYRQTYEKDPLQAALQLTEVCRQALENEMIIVPNSEDETWIEQELTRWHWQQKRGLLPFFSENPEAYQATKHFVASLLQLDKKDQVQRQKDIENQILILKNKNIPTRWLGCTALQKNEWLFLLIFLPLGPLAWLSNLPLLAWARYLRQKWVKDRQFWASMALVTGMMAWLISGLGLALLAGILGLGHYAWLVLFAWPIWGHFGLLYADVFQQAYYFNKIQKM